MKPEEMPSVLKQSLDHSILEVDETLSLVRQAKRGNRYAMAKLVRHNQRLVYSIAKEYLRFAKTLDISDLTQEGNLGLIEAIKRYDSKRDTSFSTYATLIIKRLIMQALSKKDRTIRYPSDINGHLNTFRKTILELTQKLGREPKGSQAEEYPPQSEKRSTLAHEEHGFAGGLGVAKRSLRRKDSFQLSIGSLRTVAGRNLDR